MSSREKFKAWVRARLDFVEHDKDVARYLSRYQEFLYEGWIGCTESMKYEIEGLQASVNFWKEKFEREMSVTNEANVRIAQLEDAMFKLATLGNGDRFGNSIGNCIARDALNESSDTWLAERQEREVAIRHKNLSNTV